MDYYNKMGAINKNATNKLRYSLLFEIFFNKKGK